MPPAICSTDVPQFQGLIEGFCGEVAFLLIRVANTLFIFFELCGVKSDRKQKFEEERMRNPDRTQILHRAYDVALGESLVAQNRDFADLDFGSLDNVEDHLERRRRNAPKLGSDHGELMAMLGEQFLQHDGRMIHDVRVVHRLNGQTDLAFLETIEDVGDRNRLRAFVFDIADDGALGDDENHNEAAAVAPFRLESDVVEAVRIPQRHEIAAQRVFVVNVAHFAEDQRPKGILGDAPGAAKLNSLDHVCRKSWLRARRGSLWRFELRLRRGLLGSGGWSLGHIFERIVAVCRRRSLRLLLTGWRRRCLRWLLSLLPTGRLRRGSILG